jgi:predicted RNase H-like HicB family nuclease
MVCDWGRRRFYLDVPCSSGVKAVIIEIEREEDGRWIGEIPDLPGVMVYGQTRDEAISKVEALALRAIADRLEHGEAVPELNELFAVH